MTTTPTSCTCQIERTLYPDLNIQETIVYCPLHAAVYDLRDALKELLAAVEQIERDCNEASQVISSAGTHGPTLNKSRARAMFNVIYQRTVTVSVERARAALAAAQTPTAQEGRPS